MAIERRGKFNNWKKKKDNICDIICVTLGTGKGFNLVIPEWPSGILYFLQLKSEFGNKELMI